MENTRIRENLMGAGARDLPSDAPPQVAGKFRERKPMLKRGSVAAGLLAVLCLAGTATLFTQGGSRTAASTGPRHTALDPDTESHGSFAEMVPSALEKGASLQLQEQGKPGGKSKTVLRLR